MLLDQFIFLAEKFEPVTQLILDGFYGAQHGCARRHVVRTRIYGEAWNFLPHAARQRIEQLQAFDFIVEHLDAHGQFGMLGRKHIHRIAAHAESATAEIDFIAVVLHLDQACDQVALADLVLGAQGQDHLVVFVRITDTVNRRHRCHNNHIAPLHQRFGAGQAHLLYMLID